MKKILIIIFVFLLYPVIAYSDRINEFKTNFPELIGTWSFKASPAGKPVPYQMALWAGNVESHKAGPLGILTWYTCRTGIAIYEIPRSRIHEYKITKDKAILKKYDFFKISEQHIFKVGHCSNDFMDQWPNYLLREIATGKYFIAGHTIDAKRIRELKAIIKKYHYTSARPFEDDRRQSGKAEFKIFSEVKRDSPDYNLAPALKYAEERLRNGAEIAHVRKILEDPSAVYNAGYIASRKKGDLKKYMPHQPEKIVNVGNNRWQGFENGEIYSAITNGTFKGHGPGGAYHFYQGYISLIRAYGHYCKQALKKPIVSVNYDWVEHDKWGERSRKRQFNESILMRKRYAKSFDTAYRDSQKTINVMGMMKGGAQAAMQMGLHRGKVQKKVFSDAFKLIKDEGCNNPITFQLLENYHRKLTKNSPYIQEVDKRIKGLK